MTLPVEKKDRLTPQSIAETVVIQLALLCGTSIPIMSDLEPTPDEDSLSVEDRIAAKIIEQFDFIETLPEEATVTREMVAMYAVHMDEDGRMALDQRALEEMYLNAIVRLEIRLIAAEQALRANGLKP